MDRFIDFDKDTTSRRDAFVYRLVWWIGSLQALLLSLIKQPVWRSFNGEVNTPLTMSDSHLVNTVLYCERNASTTGSAYKAMILEVNRRGLDTAHFERKRRHIRY